MSKVDLPGNKASIDTYQMEDCYSTLLHCANHLLLHIVCTMAYIYVLGGSQFT